MLNISQKEVESRLSFDNPWWNSEQATPFTNLSPRDYLPSFYNLLTDLSVKRAVILLGPRRVGKTVMVHHAIERLLKEGVEPNRVMYLALDTPVYTGFSLERLTRSMAEMNRLEPGTTRYIFFDEIQYLKEWERHLKSLVDSYPSYRFIATGSAAALRLKSQESGAGRFTDFMLPPLTFGEYIHFIGKEGLVEADPDSEKGFRQEDPSRFIKSDVIDKVLLRDLPSLYGISDIQELNSLFATLAYNTAQEVEIGKLSQNSGVVANTLARYLEYLEAAFLIKRIRRVDESAKQFKRARGFKVYLTNPSIRAALYGPVTADHEAVGALAETAIYAQWIHATAVIERLYFARWKKGLEVDVVGLDLGQRKADWVVEVKWSDRFFEHPADLKGVLAFAAANRLSRPPLTITRTCQGSKRGDGIELRFVPTSIHCYTIGRNVLRRVVAKF